MPKITKEMILEGYGYKVKVPLPEYGNEAFLIVSSPTASEVSEAKALRMRLSEVKGETDPSKIDLGKALSAAKKILILRGEVMMSQVFKFPALWRDILLRLSDLSA